MQGNLIIISSPSGGGKGTLIREVLRTVPDLGYSVSFTTRAPRVGEAEGRDYHFVTKEEFERRIEAGAFIEYAEVHGNYYGTSIETIETIRSAGKDVILEIDVQGAAWVLKRAPDAVRVFILPPSFAVLRARLTARATEGADELVLRLRNSLREVMQYEIFEYVVINDIAAEAASKLSAIILAERQKRVRQAPAIRGILDSFEESKSI
ncbi:MAG TPA: guanylate kinase [Pyrinomonadaceae bacterium]|nr:guanylate kinase [Pyrinomonadaceae bacterium]